MSRILSRRLAAAGEVKRLWLAGNLGGWNEESEAGEKQANAGVSLEVVEALRHRERKIDT